MFDLETFEATVYNAIVDDPKAETGKRDAQYIPATHIPENILKNMFGYGTENKRHPWHIAGMSWDLAVGGWRNMKNAKVIDCMPACAIVWDMSDSRTFILS